jgi:cytochrome c peroxidase
MHRMNGLRILPAFVLLLFAMLRTALPADPDSSAGYAWNLPKGFPKPYVPPDNPMTAAKVELGKYLFYDTRMSVNGKASCATCHKQELAFTRWAWAPLANCTPAAR